MITQDTCCKTYFPKKKSEVIQKFMEFKVSAEKEAGMNVKLSELKEVSDELRCYLKKCRIKSKSTQQLTHLSKMGFQNE